MGGGLFTDRGVVPGRKVRSRLGCNIFLFIAAAGGAAMTPLRFLLLEDNPLDAEVIQATLTKGGIEHTLLHVETRADFIAALERAPFDLILADYVLPGFDGLAALEIARTLAPETPFLFVSGSLGEELATESLKQGATDYVLKQQLGRLVPCVQRALREAQEHRALKQVEAERDQLLQREQAARAEAEAANRSKDEFLAVLSHELRTPLSPILGWAKLLRTGTMDATQTAKALATIEHNAYLQSELIEDLLDISRITQGRLTLNMGTVNLRTTIEAAAEMVQMTAASKSIQLEVNLTSEVGQVPGDATRLQQVVWNLLSNAMKFTPQGGQVTVQLEQVDSSAQITVSDSGIGITPDFLPHVFDSFRQADSTTTRRFGGLGIGLAIVRHLVELHDGTVAVASPGRGFGATFTIKLPLMPMQSTADRKPSSTELSQNLTGVKVLVIDDDSDSLELIAFILKQAGAYVTTAVTAKEGLLLFTQSPPDILLSDIGMFDMDGYMLMQQIRALPAEKGGLVKAMALTGYAGDLDRQQALQAGFQQHLSKPVDPETLLTAVNILLSQ
jgi:signal transduction histidine kinase